MLCIPWISGNSISRSLCCRTHGELIHVGLTNHHCACLLQILHCFSSKSRDKIAQYPGRTGCQNAFCTHIVLDCHRNTGQRSCQFSCFNLLLYSFCFCKRSFPVYGHIGMNGFLGCINPVQYCLHGFYSSGFTSLDCLCQLHCTIC